MVWSRCSGLQLAEYSVYCIIFSETLGVVHCLDIGDDQDQDLAQGISSGISQNC